VVLKAVKTQQREDIGALGKLLVNAAPSSMSGRLTLLVRPLAGSSLANGRASKKSGTTLQPTPSRHYWAVFILDWRK
jgi:hypothetical protein